MMFSEFIERTGFSLMPEEYQVIERQYMAEDIDKDEFCRRWLEEDGIKKVLKDREKKIRELEEMLKERHERVGQLEEIIADKNERIETLISSLEEVRKGRVAAENGAVENRALYREANKKIMAFREAFSNLMEEEI